MPPKLTPHFPHPFYVHFPQQGCALQRSPLSYYTGRMEVLSARSMTQHHMFIDFWSIKLPSNQFVVCMISSYSYCYQMNCINDLTKSQYFFCIRMVNSIISSSSLSLSRFWFARSCRALHFPSARNFTRNQIVKPGGAVLWHDSSMTCQSVVWLTVIVISLQSREYLSISSSASRPHLLRLPSPHHAQYPYQITPIPTPHCTLLCCLSMYPMNFLMM